jgi:hypothetical protein
MVLPRVRCRYQLVVLIFCLLFLRNRYRIDQLVKAGEIGSLGNLVVYSIRGHTSPVAQIGRIPTASSLTGKATSTLTCKT